MQSHLQTVDHRIFTPCLELKFNKTQCSRCLIVTLYNLFVRPLPQTLNEGCLPSPLGNVNVSILQTEESRIPILLSAYPWDKYSFEKSINANKVGIERGYS